MQFTYYDNAASVIARAFRYNRPNVKANRRQLQDARRYREMEAWSDRIDGNLHRRRRVNNPNQPPPFHFIVTPRARNRMFMRFNYHSPTYRYNMRPYNSRPPVLPDW